MTRRLPLDRGWKFRRLGDETARSGEDAWAEVDLPHVPFTPDLDGTDHWCGICEYERTLDGATLPAHAQAALFVGAAMHTCVVLADGREIARHTGGYLPFEVDLTAVLRQRAPVRLTLRLDNRDAPDVPPGKPLAELDFCWYGGLYREVELRLRPAVHLTDAVAADKVAGGGIFVRTVALTPQRAELAVRAHVRHAGGALPGGLTVLAEVCDGREVVARAGVAPPASSKGAAHADIALVLPDPRPWSPQSPALYTLRVRVLDASGVALDERVECFGVRRISFSRSGGFEINGRRVRLRGTNRHQEYPYAGYAVPRAAQYRDALRIKEAGFDYVRLSHYPQSPHFLDACDELGIVVMNAIPGWQYAGGPAFADACERNARELVRRDRNHPCVVLWELSLNETAMDEALMARLYAAGHEEYPGDQMYTCGWIDRYDVFVHSRQHGCIHTWRNGDRALVVAEYGDWEFYAANEGFDQKTGAGVLAGWASSRQFRAGGECALRQQAENHALALSDTLGSPAVLDGQWAVFDYARGYDPVRAAAGVMDVFRLPKYSWWFYRSQRDATEGGTGWDGGPVVFIASHWTAASDLRVLVFTNGDEVELRLNGRLVGRARPERTWMWLHLPHPPVCIDLPRFTPGTLEAVALIAGRSVARHEVTTPGEAAALVLEIDDMGLGPATDESDLLIVHARVVDAAGTLCVEGTPAVAFAVEGDASLAGPVGVEAEAGIASTVVRVPAGCSRFVLRAVAPAAGWSTSIAWERPCVVEAIVVENV